MHGPRFNSTIRLKSHVLSIALLGAVGCDWQRNSDVGAADSAIAAGGAPQLAFGASLTITHDGVAKAILRADSAFVQEEGLRFDLRRVAVTFLDSLGEGVSTLNAERGTFVVEGSQLELSGQVLVTGAGERQLRTTHAIFDPAANVLRSDSSYVLTQATPARQSEGTGFVADPRLLRVRAPEQQQ